MNQLDSLWSYAYLLTLDYPELSTNERLSAALSRLDVGVAAYHGTMPDEIDVNNRMFPGFCWYGGGDE